MSTKLFLRLGVSTALGTNNANLRGSAIGWSTASLLTTAGSSLTTFDCTTVTGTTPGVEFGPDAEFLSEPVAADTTISGAITANLWAAEANMSANAAVNFIVEKVAAIDNALTEIVRSARTTELAVTTRAVNNFAATPGAGITLNRGDRLRVRIYVDDAGTMASGHLCTLGYNGGTAGADGDSYITFTETFSLDESAPAGSVIYLTDTASDVSTASVDREAWTARGSGVQTDVTNTVAGWTAPIQVTDTAGGTVVDWFTRQLEAFTLSGPVALNMRTRESASTANSALKVEIAVVDSDGTNPSVWGSWCTGTAAGFVNNELHAAAETVATGTVSGDDKAVTAGQRLRIRVYIDDMNQSPMGASQTVTLWYAGTSGGASGDTYLTFTQTLTEFVGGTQANAGVAAGTGQAEF